MYERSGRWKYLEAAFSSVPFYFFKLHSNAYRDSNWAVPLSAILARMATTQKNIQKRDANVTSTWLFGLRNV
jgi:hypothetical protein